ncbi:MAG: 16S rRNA (adenine(1518)-N(6)/adenine(1519)-N(6))-dimethyltransferase RsmA [Sulfobacillus sp.]
MNPTDALPPASLKALLPDPAFRPRISWGQNFLLDLRVAERIVDSLELGANDSVLEIGPGTGSLTRVLTGRDARVTAIEIDRRLEGALMQGQTDKLRLVWGNALTVDWTQAVGEPLDQVSVVSNIPYAISGALLVQVLQCRPRQAVVMVQEEVAQRLVAPVGHTERGSLTLLREANADAQLLFRVKASAFWPRPTITSAVVRLTPTSRPVQQGAERLWTNLFRYRRKTVRRGLQEAFALSPQDALDVLAEAGVASQLRPQELALTAFESLAAALSTKGK